MYSNLTLLDSLSNPTGSPFYRQESKARRGDVPESTKTTKGFQPALATLRRPCVCLLTAALNHIAAYSHQTLLELSARRQALHSCTQQLSKHAGCRVPSWEETQSNSEDFHLPRGAKQYCLSQQAGRSFSPQGPASPTGLLRPPGSVMESLGITGK